MSSSAQWLCHAMSPPRSNVPGFFFCLFYLIGFFIFFFQNNEVFLGLSKIMLANGADNSAVHSFQTLRTFLVNFQNV